MNPVCPHCGKRSLRATVTVTFTNVPLSHDGYSSMDGTIVEDEIQEITCAECKKAVPAEHYYQEDPHDPGP